MRKRMIIALLFATVAAGPAVAQGTAGQDAASTTQDTDSNDDNSLWNLVGLVGVLGLFGFWRSTDNDSYTEDTSEFH